jgi:hypothetical protein
MCLVLFSVPKITAMPTLEHTANRRIPRITRHPYLTVILLFAQMLAVKLKTLAFALFVGMFIDGVFVIPDIFPRLAPLKGLTIRQTTGHLVNQGRCARFSGSQNKNFHGDSPSCIFLRRRL